MRVNEDRCYKPHNAIHKRCLELIENPLLRMFITYQMFFLPILVEGFAILAAMCYGQVIPYNIVIKETASWSESAFSSYQTIPAWIPAEIVWIVIVELAALYLAEREINSNKIKPVGERPL